MKVYKNIILAKKLGVAPSTITLWIDNALEGKNNLELYEYSKGKFRVIANKRNDLELQKLKEKNQKYIPHEFSQIVEPEAEFYKIFNEEEIVEIINSLVTKREIPMKFAYKKYGADYWNQHITKNVENGTYSYTNIDISLLDSCLDYFNKKTKDFQKINVIDIGPGNALPIKDFLGKIKKTGKLAKYIAVDISEQMLKIAKENVQTWYPDLKILTYLRDVEKQDLASILLKNSDNQTINLCFLIGGTIGNFKNEYHALNNLRNSLGENDQLIIANEIYWDLDEKAFNYDIYNEYGRLFTWLPKLLNIYKETDELKKEFDLESGLIAYYFNSAKMFTLKILNREIKIEKGLAIKVFRYKPDNAQTLAKKLISCDLRLTHMSTETFSKRINCLIMCQAKDIKNKLNK